MLLKLKYILSETGKLIESLLRALLWASFWPQIRKGKDQCTKVFILGNGPSLNSGLSQFEKERKLADELAVNLFATTNMYEIVKPKYYVINAPEQYIEMEMEEIYYEIKESIFSSIRERTNWSMELFIPYQARKYQEWKRLLGKNPNIKVTYFNSMAVEGFRWFRHLFFRMNLGMPRSHNVLIPSVMLMIGKGYEEICLLGADHSWLPQVTVNENNDVLINQIHFYDIDTSKPEPMSRMGTGKRKLHEVLHKFTVSFESYFVIREYAESKSISILNCTPGSFIDAFDRRVKSE